MDISPASIAGRVLEDASRRLAAFSLVGFLLGALAFIVAAGNLSQAQTPEAREAIRVFGLYAMFLSAAVYGVARSRMTNGLKINLGLAYVVLMAMGLGLTQFWAPPFAHFNGGLSWTAVWVLVFAVFIPSTPLRTVVVAYVSMSSDLVGYFVGRERGLAELQDVSRMILPMVTNYLLAGFAVVPSAVLTSMARQIRRAKELGSYTLDHMLGQGGMGEVWLARHTLLKRPAAVKLIRPERMESPKSRLILKRFEREAQSTALLESPHSIRVYDYGIAEDGTFYYVMELLKGLDTYKLVHRFGAVPPERVVHILIQVCASLAEAHSLGLVHRDIKPGNVYLCRRGLNVDVVKVLDFGLVKSQEEMANPTATHTARNTATGTPAYMSPEAARGVAEVDARSDLYSLGCVAYWLLTGKLVFFADNPIELMMMHVQETPTPPSERCDWEIPKDLENIVLKLLSKNPEDRFATAEELEHALRKVPLAGEWTQDRARRWWQENMTEEPGA